MKLDKQGKYRFNMYLNPKIEKDRVIIEYLEQRYSAQDYIKELLFSIATGQNMTNINNSNYNIKEMTVDEVKSIDKFEEIKGIDDIEL